MVGEPLLFFVDIEFLNIEDELLFQTVLVVVDAFEFCQPFLETFPNFLHTALLERFDACKQVFDGIDVLVEFHGKGFAFLSAEIHQRFDSLVYGIFGHFPLFIAEFFHCIGLCEFGQSYKYLPDFSR